MKKALITGITGQDGSYLAEILLSKGYEVHGIVRRSSSINTERIDHIYYKNLKYRDKKVFLHYGDVVDTSSLNRILEKVGPDEIYNLAAQSHVKISFEIPDYTAQVDALGTLRFLDAIREVGLGKVTKFYQASTSELFGKVQEVPQRETTPFYPRSPYGVAKLYGYWIIVNFREAYDLFACNGILFNHESPRRGENFVTRKITIGAVNILRGIQKNISLGNLEAKRDWGFAPEFCEGMWRILQHKKAEDFVLATGETHSIREFCEHTFEKLGIRLKWKGKGKNERGIVDDLTDEFWILNEKIQTLNFNNQISKKGKLSSHINKNDIVITINPNYFRPTEVDILIGDSSKAKKLLGWEAKTKFAELVDIMVKGELARVNPGFTF